MRPMHHLSRATIIGAALLVVGCRQGKPLLPRLRLRPSPWLRFQTRHRRLGRVHRPARGGGPGRDPAPGLGLHPAGDLHRGPRGQEGRGALRDRPSAVPGRAGPRAGRAGQARSGAALARRRWNVAAPGESPGDLARGVRQPDQRRRRAAPRVRAAEAAVETARLNLEWTRVRSPISGRVEPRGGHRGNLVQAGRPQRCSPRSSRSTRSTSTSTATSRPTCSYAGAGPSPARGWRDARSGLLGLANEDGFPHEGRPRLRGQPDRPRHRDHPHPRGLLQQGPAVHARAVRPGQAGGQRDYKRNGWCATRHRHRPGPQVRAGGQARQHPGVSPVSARAAVDGSASWQGRAQARGDVVVNGLCGSGPG